MTTMPPVGSHHVDHRTYPPGVAFMDRQYLPMSEAKISVLDYGFLHSDATYDVAHVWQGAFFRLGDHIDRFLRGVAALHMTLPQSKAEITEILQNCVALSGLQNAYVEIICTRGSSPSFSRDPRDAENRFIAFAIPWGSVANEEQMKRGLHLATTNIMRIPPASVDPTVKNYHWLDMVRALYAGYDQGADTAILIDGLGHISEGPGFNIFAVRDGAVLTPDESVLLGVTRQSVFDICAELGRRCEAGVLSLEALRSADEVFVTSTAGGVMPVSRIDDVAVGSGAIGPLTTEITQRYWDWHQQEAYRTPVAYPANAADRSD
ncbi:MAG: aminotransferase class IV [Pseudomonadota bacterium]